MTDTELKELVASLAIAQLETDKKFRETDEKFQKTDEKFQKTDEKFQKTDEKFQKTFQETDKKFRETDEKFQKTFQKTDQLFNKMARENKELRQQIGGLGNKFGSFTEGMAFPSMSKVLKEQFKMQVIATRVKAEHNNKKLELDVLAYTNGKLNTAIIVEVKSHVKQDGLEQLLKTLATFPQVFPEHADKKLYAILAYIDMPDNVRDKVLKEGIYLARIHDEQFKIKVPANFQAHCFTAAA